MASIINDKRDIFNKLSVFSSLKEIELQPINRFNSISSIDNNKDIIPFLLDLSTSLIGSDGLQDKFGLLFTQYVDSYNINSKKIIANQFVLFNGDNNLPNDFVNNGYNIPVNLLDDFNNLKTGKNDPMGELIYNNSSPNLTTSLKDSIISPGTDIEFNNISLNFNESNQLINIKPLQNTTNSIFVNSFIGGFSGLNKRLVVSAILNSIFGTKSKSQNKTKNEIFDDLLIDLIIDNLINENPIELSNDNKDVLNKKADEIFKGYNQIDLGCGFIENILTVEDLISFSNEISENTDPNSVGNNVVSLFIDNLDTSSNDSNETNLKDSFIKRIIGQLRNEILKDLIFSPEKKLLFYLVQNIQNNNNIQDNKIDFVNQNYNIVNCINDNMYSDFVEFIFKLVKTEILEVTKPALRKIITEKFNNYSLILRSLIGR